MEQSIRELSQELQVSLYLFIYLFIFLLIIFLFLINYVHLMGQNLQNQGAVEIESLEVKKQEVFAEIREAKRDETEDNNQFQRQKSFFFFFFFFFFFSSSSSSSFSSFKLNLFPFLNSRYQTNERKNDSTTE